MNFAKYPLVIGRKVSGELTDTIATGTCFLNEGDDYYTLKLMMFPGHTYFLVKNQNSQDSYTIFSKRFREGTKVKFVSQVGSAKLDPQTPTHMEVSFPIFQTQMFMCLYPQAG